MCASSKLGKLRATSSNLVSVQILQRIGWSSTPRSQQSNTSLWRNRSRWRLWQWPTVLSFLQGTSFLWHSCRTLLQDILAGHSCGTVFVGHFCGALLWITLAEQSSRTLLWDTFVWHSCGTHALVGHSCRTLLLDTLVGHFCGALL